MGMTTPPSTSSGVDLEGFNPFSPQVQQCPHAYYRAMQDRGDALFPVAGTNMHMVTRHDLVVPILRDTTTFSNNFGSPGEAPRPELLERVKAVYAKGFARVPTMLTIDPPYHTRFRGTVAPYFTPRRMGELREPVVQIVNRLIDQWIGAGSIDFVKQFGVPLPEKRPNLNDPEAKLRTALLAMHEVAAKVFEQNLAGPAGADARAYLDRRRLPLARAAEFGVGFSERGGQGLVRILKARGFSPAEIEDSGLAGKRDDGTLYDKFRGRLMFPIHNETGKVIAFGCRALYEGDEPKYLNSPGTAIYTKSLVLYHLHRAREAARRTGRLVLVEGYMDVIGAWAAGVKEAVAPCGTALTPQQVKMMSKYAPLVVVNFDPDNAGANAAEKSIAILLEEHMRIRIATLEGGLDPDEYVAAHGAEAYQNRLDKAQNYFHWLAGRAQQRFDVKTAEGKVQALEFLLPAIRRVQDPMERASLAAELANRLGVEQAMLLDQFRRMAVQRTEQRLAAPVLDLSPSEKVLMQLLLQAPEVCEFAAPVLLDEERLEHFALTSSPAWGLWQKVLGEAANGPLHYAQLEERLSPTEKNLMAGLALADTNSNAEESMMQAAACLAQFAAAGRRVRIHELKRQIRVLEQSGSLAEALSITEELYALERQQTA